MSQGRFLHAAVAAVVVGSAAAQPASFAPLDFSQAWFSPTLVESSSPLCDDLLDKATAIFRRDAPLWELEDVWGRNLGNGLAYLAEGSGLQAESVPTISGWTRQRTGESHAAPFVTVGDRKIYLHVSKSFAFGSWTRVFLEPPPVFGLGAEAAEVEYLQAFPEAKKGEPAGWLRTAAGEIVATEYLNRRLTLSRLLPSATWEVVCSVEVEPDIESSADPEIRALVDRFQAIVAAMPPLDGRGGDCSRYRHRAQLYWTLYRPVTLSYERRETMIGSRANLSLWALSGVGESNAVAAFDARVGEAAVALGRFYEQRYGWPPDQSLALASDLLKASTNFPFSSSYVAPSNRELRAAILRGAPVSEITSLGVERGTLDGGETNGYEEESLLDVAVGHPEALRYLLDLGANANQPNGFGKTPLMYAAQQNQLESVRILLAHGGDANAATIWPARFCAYALTRAKMTPLHYAVRYASPELIKTLLAAGAEPLVKIESRRLERTVFPFDWLQLYAGPDALERNPYIDEADFAELAALLAVPTEEQLAQRVRSLVLEGEAAYRAGSIAEAFAALQKALNAQPNDERALSDMSLVALRNGRPLDALDAARRLIDASANASLVANAWFNRGLACEVLGRGRHCRESRIYDFLRSAVTDESEGRLAKLDELFATSGCVDESREGGAIRYLFTYAADDPRAPSIPSSYVYVQHPNDVNIDPADVRWSLRRNDPPTQRTPAVPFERRDFSRFAVSSLRADGVAAFEVRLRSGGRCEATANALGF